MSDNFLYDGDDAGMMSELQHCHVAARWHSDKSSEREAGLSVGASIAPATDVHAKRMCIYANP